MNKLRRTTPHSTKLAKANPAPRASDSPSALEDQLKRMARPKPTHSYYALTVTADAAGTVTWSMFGGWVGTTPTEPKRDIRAASVVRADVMAGVWAKLGESFLVIDTPEDLLLFMFLGGHALVEQSLADKQLSDVVSPQAVIQTGELGFTSESRAPAHVLRRRTDKKHRMRIFKRDGSKCRICGGRPDTNEHLELHVHHIRPWARGGVTHDDNLITLCQTCHGGLDPHFDVSLFAIIAPHLSNSAKRQVYEDNVRRYREIAYNTAIANPKHA
jgi:hypothetical protein